jgi:hypothetical protein
VTRKLSKLTVAAGMLAALTWSTSAWAQQDRHQTGSHRAPEAARSAPAQSGQRAVPRGQPPAPPAQWSQRAPHSAPPRGNVTPRGRAPEARPTPQGRGNYGQNGRYGQDQRGRVAPRGDMGRVAPRGDFGRVAPRGDFGRAVRRPFFAPRLAPVVRPYYSFRPRFRLGLNFFVGYGVPFPSWYDPSGYGYGYDYGYGYGGLSFDVQPPDAAVYIDGQYAGLAGDFTPYEAPLTVVAGRHVVEITAPGYQPLTFDVSIVAGEVLPYQGTLGWIR